MHFILLVIRNFLLKWIDSSHIILHPSKAALNCIYVYLRNPSEIEYKDFKNKYTYTRLCVCIIFSKK